MFFVLSNLIILCVIIENNLSRVVTYIFFHTLFTEMQGDATYDHKLIFLFFYHFPFYFLVWPFVCGPVYHRNNKKKNLMSFCLYHT